MGYCLPNIITLVFFNRPVPHSFFDKEQQTVSRPTNVNIENRHTKNILRIEFLNVLNLAQDPRE